jgi:hypothetical protein
VPRGDAKIGVLRLRERVVAEVDAVDERQVAQSLRLTTDLGDERGGLAAAGRKQHAHAGCETFDRRRQRGASEGAGHERLE